MLHDYPSRWAIERLPMTRDYDPWSLQVAFYRALAPTLHMLSVAEGALLDAYVRGGGHSLLGPRAG